MAGLATAMFLVVLDSSMVNLAGSTIRAGLDLSAAELTAVVNGYLVPFAGLLLLGGRLADVVGGRRVFLAGMSVYVVASLLCASATSGGLLVAARVVQGVGAAIVVPAALSLVLGLYTTAAERTRAMGIWGAVAGAGSLCGVFLGGVMTQALGWPSVFWTPVPFGVAAAIVVWRAVPSAPPRATSGGRFDVLGAAAITLGLSAVAYGLIAAPESGWGSPVTVAGLVAGALLLVAFVVIERRSAHPLVPLEVFRRGPVVTGNLVMLLVGGTLTALFFFLPQYQQQVLGMSPLTTGLTQVPIAVMIIVGSATAPLLAKLVGLARALPTALAVLLAGLLWLALDTTRTGFSASLLIAFLLIGLGLGLGAVNATAIGVRDTAEGEGGLLSGLVNASQQVGGAVGLAALAGVATTGAEVSFGTAFLGQSALAVLALAIALVPALTSSRKKALQ